ncbi:MAG: hypothetical protein ACRED1_14355 [Limisphaerales bacterium]
MNWTNNVTSAGGLAMFLAKHETFAPVSFSFDSAPTFAVSWSDLAGGFGLQISSNLLSWTDATNTPNLTNNQDVIVFPVAGTGPAFFRISK